MGVPKTYGRVIVLLLFLRHEVDGKHGTPGQFEEKFLPVASECV